MNTAFQQAGALAPPNQHKAPFPSYSRRLVPACPDAGRAQERARSLPLPRCSPGLRIPHHSNRKSYEKLENQLTRSKSATSQFLIDNFCRDLLTGFTSHSPLATSHSFLARAPFFAGLAKSEFFSISNRQVHRKLENRLTPAPSTSSKFLIDNFCRDLRTGFTGHSLALTQEGPLATSHSAGVSQ